MAQTYLTFASFWGPNQKNLKHENLLDNFFFKMMQKHIILESPNLKKEEEEEENPAVKRKGPQQFQAFEHI